MRFLKLEHLKQKNKGTNLTTKKIMVLRIQIYHNLVPVDLYQQTLKLSILNLFKKVFHSHETNTD